MSIVKFFWFKGMKSEGRDENLIMPDDFITFTRKVSFDPLEKYGSQDHPWI